MSNSNAGGSGGPSAAPKGLAKPMKLSSELQAVVGAGPMPRTEVTKALWVYIKANNLQNPENKREIVADDKLKKLFGGKDRVNMFEMTKLVSKHMS
jgi:chromatin remodeling complex protein RSC6